MSDKMTLKGLRKLASDLGLTIEAVRDDFGWGYWLVGTGWEDDNFCTSHDELEYKLKYYQDH
mgnify:CR=1 FL=1|tara:strand:- start:314 stop:499 length:186 start_codon:yes stop_codon:yes gene_type:complete